ncbi:MAG: hypothetical protein WC479_08295, partial [Candidatus Izemoplasmatales bacterium]
TATYGNITILLDGPREEENVIIEYHDKMVFRSRDNFYDTSTGWRAEFHKMIEDYNIKFTTDGKNVIGIGHDGTHPLLPQNFSRRIHTLHDTPRSSRSNARECVTILQTIQEAYAIDHDVIINKMESRWAATLEDRWASFAPDVINPENMTAGLTGTFMSEAVVVYWKHDIWVTATQDYEKMAGVTCKLPARPLPVMFWGWENAPYDEENQAVWAGMAVIHLDPDLFYARVLISDQKPEVTFHWQKIVEGQKLETPFDLTTFMAVKFMTLPFVKTETQQLPTKEAKRLRKKRKAMPPELRLVEFRMPQGERTEVSKSTESTSISTGKHRSYSCSFPVRGHWRNQWYRSTKTHELIWIGMHLGGDLKKPLKLSKKVYKVTRPRQGANK